LRGCVTKEEALRFGKEQILDKIRGNPEEWTIEASDATGPWVVTVRQKSAQAYGIRYVRSNAWIVVPAHYMLPPASSLKEALLVAAEKTTTAHANAASDHAKTGLALDFCEHLLKVQDVVPTAYFTAEKAKEHATALNDALGPDHHYHIMPQHWWEGWYELHILYGMIRVQVRSAKHVVLNSSTMLPPERGTYLAVLHDMASRLKTIRQYLPTVAQRAEEAHFFSTAYAAVKNT